MCRHFIFIVFGTTKIIGFVAFRLRFEIVLFSRMAGTLKLGIQKKSWFYYLKFNYFKEPPLSLIAGPQIIADEQLFHTDAIAWIKWQNLKSLDGLSAFKQQHAASADSTWAQLARHAERSWIIHIINTFAVCSMRCLSKDGLVNKCECITCWSVIASRRCCASKIRCVVMLYVLSDLFSTHYSCWVGKDARSAGVCVHPWTDFLPYLIRQANETISYKTIN